MDHDRKSCGLTGATATFAAGLISFAMMSAPAVAQDKMRVHERQAIHIRVLQSNMMIAALNCDLKQQYSDAVSRFQPEFVVNAGHLRAYFDRTYGKSGRAKLDRFVTALANQASSRAVSKGMDYCQSASILMEQVLSTPANALTEFSAHLAGAEEVTFMPLADR